MGFYIYISAIVILAIIAVAFVVLYLRQRRVSAEYNVRAALAEESVRSAAVEREQLLTNLNEAKNACRHEQEARIAEQMVRVKLEAELEAERRSVADKVRTQEELTKTMREQFRNLAGDIMGEQSRRFKEENRESMDVILKPFKDNITEFRTRVENIFTHQNEQTGVLKSELKRLMDLNVQITTETTNLTNALKGNSKVQGDWGEVILDTILENSNLIRGVHYHTQLNVKDEQGNNLRPDVVLNLPGRKQVVIDSKVSLTAYVNYVGAESDAERRAAMSAHVASVRQHVRELGAKSYQQLMQSPDFVIMFVPNEPAFLDALKADNDLWSDAYNKKVVISSPTNLFALLKIVNDLWQRDEQSKNQAAILDTALKLYNQLVDFSSALEGVGGALKQARTKYDEAHKRLCTGNNNVVRLGERLRKLGAVGESRKTMPKSFMENYDGMNDGDELPEIDVKQENNE
jgi:DNA recombination protein RmuC